VEPLDSRRTENINVLDVRAEKQFSIAGPMKLNVFADFFNITNSDAPEVIGFTTGLQFERPTQLLAPRTMRIGFRFIW
jgi:hypothetical protein